MSEKEALVLEMKMARVLANTAAEWHADGDGNPPCPSCEQSAWFEATGENSPMEFFRR